MSLPWETLASGYVIENAPWFTLRKDSVRLPGGGQIDGYWVVEQPPWANVVAITDDDRMVLVRQYRYALGREGLELPGGYVDDGETPLEGARRELLEETGFGGGTWSELLRVAPNPALQNNILHCFLAQGVSEMAAPTLEPNEDLRVELRERGELRSLIEDGTIHNALHIAPLLAFEVGLTCP